MALYFYHAFSKDGKKITGQLDSPSEQGVKDYLLKKSFFPTQIGLARGTGAGIPWYKRIFEGKVPVKEKILFTKQLMVLLRSGVPLLQAMELLVDQFQGKLRSVLVHIKDEVKEGQGLADGMNNYPKIFDNIYVQLVRAGEATGNLEFILGKLVIYLERSEAVRKKVKAAMSYPIIQLSIVGLVVIVLLTFVVPQLADTFADSGAKLPWSTQFLMSLSEFIQSYYLVLLVLGVGFVSGFKYWSSTPKGGYWIDKIKLRIPLIKYFVRMSAVVQFTSTLGMLLQGGVRLSEALSIVCDIVSNRVLATTLLEAKENIIKEGKITQYLKKTKVFPSMAIYLINTGEESGELAGMLQTVSENYEVELMELTDSLSSKIEPIMMIVMALIVGFVVISMVVPITQMNDLASQGI